MNNKKRNTFGSILKYLFTNYHTLLLFVAVGLVVLKAIQVHVMYFGEITPLHKASYYDVICKSIFSRFDGIAWLQLAAASITALLAYHHVPGVGKISSLRRFGGFPFKIWVFSCAAYLVFYVGSVYFQAEGLKDLLKTDLKDLDKIMADKKAYEQAYWERGTFFCLHPSFVVKVFQSLEGIIVTSIFLLFCIWL